MSVYGGQRDSAFGKFALEQKIEVRDARRGHLDAARGVRQAADAS